MSTKKINVGGAAIGGGAPITVQSMTNTKTENIAATLSQIERLAAAGCDIVRLAVPTMAAAAALGSIRERSPVPIVADIHFDYKLALEAVKMGVDKIRINPGNIGGEDKVRAVANACREKNIPIRIGVNGGSLDEDLLQRYGMTAEAMYMSAMGHVKLLNKFDFNDICISVKASDVMLTVEAYRMMAEKTDYPLHLGVTEAGTEYMGIMRSAAGIGALLAEGIGDTIRVSLTAPPEREAIAGVALLKALGIRRDGVRIISCPSCGRCNIDLIGIAGEVEMRLSDVHKDCTVAIMGCAVNGPGEAREADFGMAGGKGEGLLFQSGKIIKKVPMALIVDALVEMVTGG